MERVALILSFKNVFFDMKIKMMTYFSFISATFLSTEASPFANLSSLACDLSIPLIKIKKYDIIYNEIC